MWKVDRKKDVREGKEKHGMEKPNEELSKFLDERISAFVLRKRRDKLIKRILSN